MPRNISLKRLSASDLTFFEPHYRTTAGTKQKAINLDADVFVTSMFPLLPRRLGMTRDRVIVSLSIYGPSGAGAHNVTRKILKQQKNWRLNGELIVNPPEEPGRYDVLARGDFAVLAFAGEPEPSTARMYLVSRANDAALHLAIENRFGAAFTSRRGMSPLSSSALGELLRTVSLPEGHPIFDFIDDDLLEDAVQGGWEGTRQLWHHRNTRGVSREELLRARESADYIGRFGEEIFKTSFDSGHVKADFLLNEPAPLGADIQLVWDSDSNAVAPHDFSIQVNGVSVRVFEVKSTRGNFTNRIHISYAELQTLAWGGLPYDLVRIYDINEQTARVRICREPRQFARDLVQWLAESPPGVTIDSVSIDPNTLPFGDEMAVPVRWL